MKGINPKLVVALLLVIACAVYIQLSNPYKKYSQQAYWETATVQDVYTIPDEALKPGNKHGPVLLWAAATTKDPDVIKALVKRGADINESDIGVFSGTPLSAAAGHSTSPEIIDTLVELGADIHQVVGSNDKTPLIIGAELNKNTRVIESLIHNGSNLKYKDLTGKTALEQAKRFNNKEAQKILEAYSN